MFTSDKIWKIRIPGIGAISFTLDSGEGDFRSTSKITTNLSAVHFHEGKPVKSRNLGRGVITVVLVNTMVSDAVNGSSVIPTLARFKQMDSGTGITAATDGDTTLQTPTGIARVAAALSNGQTATTGNHTAKLQYQGTITYNGPFAITEWGMFDLVSGGNMMDHRIFSAWNVVSTDSIQFTYTLSLPSNN